MEVGKESGGDARTEHTPGRVHSKAARTLVRATSVPITRQFAPSALNRGRYNISLTSEGPYIHPSGVSPPSGVVANGDAVVVYKCAAARVTGTKLKNQGGIYTR